MKRTVLIFSVLLFSKQLSAQISKDSLLSLIAADVCVNLSDKPHSTEKELELQMTQAFLPLVSKYSESISKYYDLENETDSRGYRQLGIDVGMKMMSSCPVFMKNMMQHVAEEKENEKTPDISKPKRSYLSGTLLKIIPGEFTYLSIKTEAGQMQKIWWLEYFEGSDKLTPELYNKPVTIEYIEKEMYNATLKDYIKIKIATGVKQ